MVHARSGAGGTMRVRNLHKLIAAAVAGFAFTAGLAVAQTLGEPENFSASAIDINSGWTGRIDISVDRWSTNAERDKLIETLFKKGSDALLEAVRDLRTVGRIRTPGSIGYELRYASWRRLPEGGRE